MSESTSAPVEPVAVAPAEPAVVETTAAPVVETVAETAPAAEPVAEEKVPSLLSEAKPEDAKLEPEPAKAEEAKPEPKIEEPKAEEVKAEPETKVEEPAKPLPAPTYESFKIPDGVNIADDKLGAFTGILGEYENKIVTDPAQAHAMVQELGQKLVDFYIGEMKETAERSARLQRETWDRTIEDWRGEFRKDPDIGGNRSDTSLARMGSLLEMYGQKAGAERLSKLRDVFTNTGAGDNPEVLRFVNWAASRLVETPRPVSAISTRAPVVTSRAARLYRNTPGAA